MNESLSYQEKKLGLILADKKGQTFTSLKNIVFNLIETNYVRARTWISRQWSNN